MPSVIALKHSVHAGRSRRSTCRHDPSPSARLRSLPAKVRFERCASYRPRLRIELVCLIVYPLVGLAAMLAFGRGHGLTAVFLWLFVLPAGLTTLTAKWAHFSPSRSSAGVIGMCVVWAIVALSIAVHSGAITAL